MIQLPSKLRKNIFSFKNMAEKNKAIEIPPNNTEFHLGVSGAPTKFLKLPTLFFMAAYRPD